MSFRRTILFVALASAGTAVAQTPVSNVQLYGRLNTSLDSYRAAGSAGGATNDYKSRTRISDTASRLGVRGTEELGGGLKAIFQIETGVNIDTGSQTSNSGTANPNTGFLASRESWAGFESASFGRLTFGRQSAYWANGTIDQIGANYINAASPLNSYQASGIVIGPVSRESNTAQYSARFGGFSFTGSYGFSTATIGSTSPYESAGGGANPRDKFYALTLRYNHERFDLQADYAKRLDVAGAQDRDASGFKLGAAWKYAPGAQVSVIAQRLQLDNTFGFGVSNAATPLQVVGVAATTAGLSTAQVAAIAAGCGALTTASAPGLLQAQVTGLNSALFSTGGGGTINRCDNLRQDMISVQWEQVFGNWQPLVQYARAGQVKGSSGSLSDTGVQSYLVAVRYIFSRRTAVYASFNQIRNEKNNYVDYWGGWNTSAANNTVPGLAPRNSGADPRVIALGLIHNF